MFGIVTIVTSALLFITFCQSVQNKKDNNLIYYADKLEEVSGVHQCGIVYELMEAWPLNTIEYHCSWLVWENLKSTLYFWFLFNWPSFLELLIISLGPSKIPSVMNLMRS